MLNARRRLTTVMVSLAQVASFPATPSSLISYVTGHLCLERVIQSLGVFSLQICSPSFLGATS